MYQALSNFLHPDDDVILAQVDAFRQRIPILYAILSASTVLLAFTHYATGPLFVTVIAPGIIVVIMCARLVYWCKLPDVAFTAESARRAIAQTTVFGTVLGLLLLAWAVTLLNYDVEPASSGEISGDGHVALYVGLTVICCICLLMHVRVAAIGISASIVPAFATVLFLTASPIEIAVALNLLLVAGGMVYVLTIFARDFEFTVQSKADLRRLNKSNERLAHTDALTGLPNRRQMFVEIDEARRTGSGYALLLLDLDGFKQINDIYGHVVGDELLSAVGKRLVAHAPADACVARMGGDEFALFLPGPRRNDDVLALGNQLISVFEAPISLSASLATVGASVGISIAKPGEAGGDHYQRADYALFNVKKTGRGHAEVFSPAHERTILRDSAIEQALKRCDFDAEFNVMYQPIVSSQDGQVIAYEALARWASAELGSVSPAVFIPIAERSDVIHRLTRTILTKALAAAEQWPAHLRIKINLSIHDLASSAQVLRLLSIVRGSRVAPARISFEITESALIEDVAAVQSAIDLLRALGASVDIDDFGSGYSNLCYIQRLLPDTIKIDRSFVQRLDTDDDNAAAMIRTIVELCHNVGARALAEGAETARQVEILRRLGCDEIQGYYFGCPSPVADVLAALRQTEQVQGLA